MRGAKGGVRIRRQRDAVRTDIHPGIVQHPGDDLGARAGGNADLEAFALLLDQDVEQRLRRRDFHLAGDLGQHLAVIVQIDRGHFQGGEIAVLHFRQNAGAGVGFLQPRHDGGAVAFLRPGGQRLGQIGPAGFIGIGIAGDVHAIGARLFRIADEIVRIHAGTGAVVENLHRDMGPLGDLDGFFQSFVARIVRADIADMDGEDAAIFTGHLAQFDQLGGREEHVGDIGHAVREAEGALLHALADQLLDAGHFGRGRLAVLVAHRRGAHLSGAHI